MTLAAVMTAALPASAAAVYGGERYEGAAPRFLVSIFQGDDAADGHVCGGSLIAPSVVLTAAHCLVDDAEHPLHAVKRVLAPSGQLRVRLGPSDLRARGGMTINVVRQHVHPLYLAGPGIAAHDVGILELEQPARGFVPVRLAGPDDGVLYKAHVSATVLGWGCAADGCRQPALRRADAPVWDDLVCKVLPEYTVMFDLGSQLCAGAEGSHAGGGDSGGPLIALDDERMPVLIGIVSYVAVVHAQDSPTGGRGIYHPTVFADVHVHRDFIDGYVK